MAVWLWTPASDQRPTSHHARRSDWSHGTSRKGMPQMILGRRQFACPNFWLFTLSSTAIDVLPGCPRGPHLWWAPARRPGSRFRIGWTDHVLAARGGVTPSPSHFNSHPGLVNRRVVTSERSRRRRAARAEAVAIQASAA